MPGKNKSYLLLLLFFVVAINSPAQRISMLVYKSGAIIFKKEVAEIDSVKFYQTGLHASSQKETMFVYRNGAVSFQKYTAEIDSFTFSSTEQNSSLILTGSLTPLSVQGCSVSDAPPTVTTVAELEQLPGTVSVNEGCSGKDNLSVTYVDIPDGGCPVTVYRTYTVKDDCNNMASVIQQITIEDITRPVVTRTLTTVTVSGCTANDAPPAVTTVAALEQLEGTVTVKDDCTTKDNLTVSFVDIPVGNCPITVNRTYSIKDACNNSSSVTQMIIIKDNTSSVASGSLDAITITGCTIDDVPKPVTTVAALEQLSGTVTIKEECTRKEDMVVTSKDEVMSVCPLKITRTYEVRMDCNTTRQVPQPITIEPEVKTVDYAVFIPCGTFTMGSPVSELKYLKPDTGDDELQHEVTVSAFYMSKYEVSNAEFAAFLNAKNVGPDGIYRDSMFPDKALLNFNDSRFEPWGVRYSGGKWIPYAGFENHPVVFETWYGAAEYAKYVGGRLPTEAEWEYACRAGTTTPFSIGTGYCLTDSDANYDYRYPYDGCQESPFIGYHTVPVNSFKPNPWGLYNMNGNAGEWCSDWYGPYPGEAQINPTGSPTGTNRVSRGGVNSNIASCLRSAYRGLAVPEYGSSTTGFRVAYDCSAVD